MVKRIFGIIFALVGLAAIIVAIVFGIQAVQALVGYLENGIDPMAPLALVIFVVMIGVWAALGIIGLVIFIPSLIVAIKGPKKKRETV
ncbi:MAG: hypothetical protein EOM77_00955 [Bacteroidia bacterium]|nr:hypothetical protein [Bacteroidia bacterium]